MFVLIRITSQYLLSMSIVGPDVIFIHRQLSDGDQELAKFKRSTDENRSVRAKIAYSLRNLIEGTA